MNRFRLLAFAACLVNGCAWERPFSQLSPQAQERQLDELVRTIDDHPDPCHVDYTPSVHRLIEIGEPAVPRMLDLLLLGGEEYHYFTHMHAKKVILHVCLSKYGWQRSGSGWADPKDEERFNEFWNSMPQPDHEGPLQERESAVKVWREWFAKQKA